MQTPKIIKSVMLIAAFALLPDAGAYAHGEGHGMMPGGGPGMMGGQGPNPGYGYGTMGPGMMGPGYGMGYGMNPGMMGPGMMNRMHSMMMGPGYGHYGMGPGMMGPGYGYGMGPGMMGPGHGYGVAPGMMGPGYGPGMTGATRGHEVSEEDVRGVLDRQLQIRGLSRLKVGTVDASDERVFKADIVTKEDSLAVRVVIDRRTGFPVAFE